MSKGETLDPEILVDRYEYLRQEILSCEIGSRLGLSVFLRQGMVGWIRMQAMHSVSLAHPPTRRLKAPVPEGLAGELTRILTHLIVTRKELAP